MIMAQPDAKRHASAEENNNETDTDAQKYDDGRQV